ncbi:DUF4142 domain-containing protein [Lysobacter xanthus]
MNSKTPLALAIAALVLFGTAACNRNEDANGGTNNTPAATADTATSDATTPGTTADGAPTAPATDPAAAGNMATPSQPEALALLNAVNEHEVKAAEQAKSKKVTGDVLAYANMMQTEHSKNMTMTTSLLEKNGPAPGDSPTLSDMKAKGEAEMQQLAALDGDAYAKAYMDAMVMGHQDTLTKLDSMLLPAATDAAVKQHLQMTRDAVQKHLDQAKQIQSKLGGGA